MAKMLSIVYIIRMTLIVEAFISQTINKTLELNAAQRTTGPVTTLPISTRRPTDDIKSPIDSDLASIAPMLCGIERKHFLSKIHVILKGDRKDNADIFRYAAKQVVKNLCKKSRKAKKKDLHCVLRKLYDTDGDGVIDDEERMQFTQTSVYTKGSEYQLEGCDLIKKSKAKRNRRRERRQRHRGH